jgi:hypothetical protein
MSGLLKYLVCGLIQDNAMVNWFVLLHVQVTQFPNFRAARLSPYRDDYVLVT